MSAQELRELDFWISIHVMGRRTRNRGSGIRLEIELPCDDGTTKWCGLNLIPNYTTNPADAFAVLEKCAEKLGFLPDIKKARIGYAWASNGMIGDAPTLPLAIVLFAKQLFSK